MMILKNKLFDESDNHPPLDVVIEPDGTVRLDQEGQFIWLDVETLQTAVAWVVDTLETQP
jgi:hypothetical protein